jgi:hypothetical protein
VFDVTSKFIGVIDILELNIREVDQIAPQLRDAHTALKNYPSLPPTYQGLNILTKWVGIMDQKKVTDDLSEDEIRQLKYEV